MSVNGRVAATHDGQALAWPRRVLSLADLRRRLNGHREISVGLDTVITPLAVEELRDSGVRVVRQAPASVPYGHGQDRAYPLVASARQALTEEGLTFREWPEPDGLACRWAKAVAECVAGGECSGGVLFCADPGLACCVANKVPGLRAVPVTTVQQAARATLSLAANLLVV